MTAPAHPSDLVAIARAWLDCFARQEVDQLVALYHPNAEHTSPKLRVSRPDTGGKIVGRDALRAWWADAFVRLPKLRYVERTLTADGGRVFMEYLRVVPGEPDLPVAEVLVVKNGLITESRVYHG